MFKKILFAVIPLVALMATTAMADDDVLGDLAGLKLASISDAKVEIDDGNLDIDLASLSEQAGGKSDEAVEACFRRFGYGGYGCGYGYYGCYSPYYYSYNVCYQPFLVYRPVYYTTCYYPTYSYWGCW